MPKCKTCGRPKTYISLNRVMGRIVLVECVRHKDDYDILDIPNYIPKSQVERYINAKV